MVEQKRRSDLINQDKVRKKMDKSRKVFSISLSYETWNLIDRLVETGAGKYGSAILEHAARFFIACLTGDSRNIEVAVDEIQEFVITPEFANNLRKIADTWDKKRGDIEL